MNLHPSFVERALSFGFVCLAAISCLSCGQTGPAVEDATGRAATGGLVDVASAAPNDTAYVRVNLIGYLPEDPKIAIVFSESPISGPVRLIEVGSGNEAAALQLVRSHAKGWGRFDYHYEADFSSQAEAGTYYLEVASTEDRSADFRIGADAYGAAHEDLLVFMRQQRCGYNPHLDMACHRKDGRTAYGPLPESSFIDVSGGWHDAGDQLKYLITSSFATGAMLLAYELEADKFHDRVDDLGYDRGNGVPDVLDEARWGLEWLHKMHPEAGHLYHQVADDRDHRGWKWPNEDISDYGWGPNSYRVAYFADGNPQGLGRFKSKATGVANLAGRVAATMAMAYRLYAARGDSAYAARALQAAEDVYRMGEEKEGYQQGNSYGAPYRYTEDTWADDMEWGAAELFKATGYAEYLSDARRYAELIGTTSWLPHDTTDHYQYYPFINVGHFALYPLVDAEFQEKLAGYYRDGIEAAMRRGSTNPYRVGVPFIWCSNNLATALISQILLYERMTGDMTYHDFMVAQRDWLLGRNPWGTSMFTGIPANAEHPDDVHTSVWALTRQEVPGGLVDGPVYGTIFRSLSGLSLNEPDEFAHLQNPFVVYHDDIGDYSTNEPTMDGTAGAIYMMSHFAAPVSSGSSE